MLGIWTLVFLVLVLRPEVWLALSIFTSQPSISANCLLVLLFQQGFDCEQVEKGLLNVRLVGLVARVFFQLGLLSARTILGLRISKTV